ncbi:Transcription elongation factor, partial [Parasponia andersonii]
GNKSGNFSRQFPVSSTQGSQLEPLLNKMDSSISEMPMGVVGSVGYISSLPVLQQFPVSNRQTTPISDNPLPQELQSVEMQMGQIEAIANNGLQSERFVTPNNQVGQMGSMLNMEQMSAPFKRKAPMESISLYPTSELLSTPNKRMAQMQHRPWLQQISAPNRRAMQLDSMPNSPGSQSSPAPNKKMVKMDSFSNKSGSQRTSSQRNQSARMQPPPNQSARMQPPPKVSTELSDSESVRSKMREQLVAALTLVPQQEDKPSHMENNSPGQGNHQPADPVDPVTMGSNETLPTVEKLSEQKKVNEQGESQKILANVQNGDLTLATICDGREFQSNNVLSYDDVSFSDNFFVKDELLQGNGLSWVLDSEIEMAERKKMQNAEKQEFGHEDVTGDMLEQAYQSPQNLALKIEAELFKLFGGVNKKYKEKGRSLLFNLKDRNNPELRERVMRGEISPERLCSMTAEELASKELSEWRMAKAEELAQMVVLPDSDVDIRRLVRKTHKGEFQVEVEQDDSLPVDISGGSGTVSQSRPKSKEMGAPDSKSDGDEDKLNALGEHGNLVDQSTSCTFTIPSNEGTDLMQGLMVDDGLKDAEFLPPIVSLDEFMESLDSEPPFEIIPLDSETRTPISEKDDSEAGSGSKSSDLSPKDDVDTSSEKRHDNSDATQTKTNMDEKPVDGLVDLKSNDHYAVMKPRKSLLDVKSSNSPLKTETSLLSTSKGEHVWGGSLQLNISTTAIVTGVFKSGEKTSAKEWPGFLEIKGRVRLEAFEKFLQELPLSRSRAVMVVHFVLKERSSENESALREVADSYTMDERVGFAEPASGVELYLCPPHNKTLEMLGKIIQKEHTEALNEIDNGLIGVIVWRKLSSTSPKSSSHHKHSSKKQHFTSRRQQDSTLNSSTLKQAIPLGVPPTNSRPSPSPDDDEDDVPPGFGPQAARGHTRGDEDDLPEFNFSGGSNPPMSHFSAQKPSRGPGMAPYRPTSHTSRPVEQVRELIHKYGQNNTSPFPGNWKDKRVSGVAVQPWNDDDDDIPEWQPQAPTQQEHNFQPSMLRPHILNQQHPGLVSQQPAHQAMLPMQSLQPPMNAAMSGSENPALWQQQGTWWVPLAQGNGLQPSNISCQPDVGQLYGASGRVTVGQPGMAWRQNAPKSRGF